MEFINILGIGFTTGGFILMIGYFVQEALSFVRNI